MTARAELTLCSNFSTGGSLGFGTNQRKRVACLGGIEGLMGRKADLDAPGKMCEKYYGAHNDYTHTHLHDLGIHFRASVTEAFWQEFSCVIRAPS